MNILTKEKLIDLGFGLDIIKSERFDDYKVQLSIEQIAELVEYNSVQIEVKEKQSIEELVIKYELNLRSRKRYLVYNRVLLAHYLKENTNYTLTKIGGLMNLKHDTVIYYLGLYKIYARDKDFIKTTAQLKNDLR